MANDKKKMVEAITAQEVDFAQWYTDICTKAELVEYSSVKGFVVLRPYGYAIWENIQKILDVCQTGEPFWKALENTGVFPVYVIKTLALGRNPAILMSVCSGWQPIMRKRTLLPTASKVPLPIHF